MSGNYVQRGELAVIDKYVRAEAAIRCGADIVLELPYPWSCGSAEYFSRGAVGLYSAIASGLPGIEFRLCFGSESGDLSKLVKTAECLLDDRYISAIGAKESERQTEANPTSECATEFSENALVKICRAFLTIYSAQST